MRRTAALGTVCAAVALAAGCSGPPPDPDAGTNGIGRQAPDTIAAKARAAALGASSVHLSGTVVSAGATYRLDMRLKSGGGTGKVVSGARTFELLRVGSQLYVKGDAAFYSEASSGSSSAVSASASAKLEGKYVRVHSTDPSYRQLSVFTDKAAMLGSVTDLGGPARKADYRKVDGLRTVAVTTDGGSTVRVSLQGTPLPVEVDRPGNAGTLTLSEYGRDFTVTAPSAGQVLDFGTGSAATGKG
ncbi:hypothetical protein [Peterkaempfera sp. SMS 1(5)a]|uniref:hypothetical protein n=1 Tax=Peterkaempfera podocarpi TaxID=3232308 RepID=UPI00366AC2EB